MEMSDSGKGIHWEKYVWYYIEGELKWVEILES